MMHKTIKFTVYGKAQTAGSKKAFAFKRRNGSMGASVVDDNPKSRDWKSAVTSEGRRAYAGELLQGPLLLRLRFFLVRPKGHSGKKGLRQSAPQYPDVKPDALKLTRAVEDALTGVVWRDDSQIVREAISKDYGEPARVEIEVIRLDDLHPAQADEALTKAVDPQGELF